MKGNSLKLLVVSLLLFMTIIACASLAGNGSPAPGTSAPAPQATSAPQATAQPAASKYFQEDFNGNLSSDWSQFVINGSKVPKGGNPELSKRQLW